MKKLLPYFPLTLLLLTSPVSSEVYNCAGKYQNRPCDDSKSGEIVFKETAKKPVSEDERLKKEKSLEQTRKMNLVYELLKYSKNVQSKHGVTSFKTKAAEDFCKDQTTSLEDCREKISIADKELMQYQNESEKKQLEAIKIQDERERAAIEQYQNERLISAVQGY